MKQLILNPVENLPFLITDKTHFEVHGLYVSDKVKTDKTMRASKIAFSGRSELNREIRRIYDDWADALHAAKLSMRLLSGLHAHTLLFMGLGKIGDTVLLLPEDAGGHYATESILRRLGYRVLPMIPDRVHHRIDMDATLELLKSEKPEFVFVDRSEGLCYEDFSPLATAAPQGTCCVFDASQYLTNILCEDFASPFDWGFDIMMATLHKNFPGPQKALVCSKADSVYWKRIEEAMSNYVSSLHVDTTLLAGELLRQRELLRSYSEMMLDNCMALDRLLQTQGMSVVQRQPGTPTHHIWLTAPNSEDAFSFFKKMESCGLLVNYRKLPYGLGYGIRMGTAAATLQGVNEGNREQLARLIHKIYSCHAEEIPYGECQEYISDLEPLPDVIAQRMDSIS